MPTKTTTTRTRRTSKPAPKMDDVMSSSVNHDMIAQRAFELFMERGGKHGHHVEDWLRAERELLSS